VRKRIILVLVLAAVISGAAFAQNFWISGEASIAGGGVRAELMLFQGLSVGINYYWNYTILPEIGVDLGIDFSIRLYPGSGSFFFGIGLGYHENYKNSNYSYTFFSGVGVGSFNHERKGFGITPEIGWKIDLGRQGAFFIQPGIKVPLIFIKSSPSFLKDVDTNISYYYDKDQSIMGIGIIPYIGIGYAF